MKQAILVLGGGSAYGLAHIGVIRELEKHYKISSIIGTSMGAIVGGAYASGVSTEDLQALAEDVSIYELFKPRNLDWRGSGIFDGKVLVRLFEEWTNSKRIENGVIPFTAVAYDLNLRNSVLFNSGLFADAMRASSSLPLIFAPHELGGYFLVDGGVSHPLPIAFAESQKGEITIAVNVLPPVADEVEYYREKDIKTKHKHDRISIFLESLMQNQGSMALHSILQYEPDIVIDAHHPELGFTDLKKAKEFCHWGEIKAQEALRDHEEPGFMEKLREGYRKILGKYLD